MRPGPAPSLVVFHPVRTSPLNHRFELIIIGPSGSGKSTFRRCLSIDTLDATPYIPIFRRNLLEIVHCLAAFQRKLSTTDPSLHSALSPEARTFLAALNPHHPASWATPGLAAHLDRFTNDPGIQKTVELLSTRAAPHARAVNDFLRDEAPPCMANAAFFLADAQKIISNDFSPARTDTLYVYHRHSGSNLRYASTEWDREAFERSKQQFLRGLQCDAGESKEEVTF